VHSAAHVGVAAVLVAVMRSTTLPVIVRDESSAWL
jgi:hypothetical protein